MWIYHACYVFFFVQNKVKEMHYQLANYLAKNFRQILIPALPVAEFVKLEKRKLGKETVKNMLAWSHYAFRQRLKNTVRRHPWCEVCLFVLYDYIYECVMMQCALYFCGVGYRMLRRLHVSDVWEMWCT